MAGNIHENHRNRMRTRAIKDGFSSFADHELLEFLLYYTIPRVDTNPTAHALLAELESIRAIMDASADELCRVKGVGPNSALLFDLMIEFLRRYEADHYKTKPIYNTELEAVHYLRPKFCGLNVERVYMMLLDNSMSLIDCVLLSEGNVNCSEASIRKITEIVLNKKVSSVILAHNHPNGLAVPSSEDKHLTDTLHAHLGMLGVILVEHFLFAGTNYLPIMKHHVGLFRCSPISKRLECDFYKRFYANSEENYLLEPFFYKPSEEELEAVVKKNEIK